MQMYDMGVDHQCEQPDGREWGVGSVTVDLPLARPISVPNLARNPFEFSGTEKRVISRNSTISKFSSISRR